MLSLAQLPIDAAFAQDPDGLMAVHGERTSIALSVPALREPLAERRRLGELVQGCRDGMDVTESDSASVVNLAPPVIDRGAYGRDAVLELSIMPRASKHVDCGPRSYMTGMLEDRGLWVAFDTVAPPELRIARVSIVRGGTPVEPVGSRRGTLRRLGPGGLIALDGHFLRLALPLEAVAPDSAGLATDVVVEVFVDSSRVPDRIVIPWLMLREMWDHLLPLRAERLTAVPNQLALPPPKDERLRDAATAYARGDVPLAASLAANAVWTRRLDVADRRFARAQNAMLFAEAGDTPAARINLEYLLQENPCFSWDAAVPARTRELTAQQRRGAARCETVPLRTVALRAAVLPGFGRPQTSVLAKSRSAALFAVLAGGVAEGIRLRSEARSQYAAYLASSDATLLYDRAESTRKTGIAVYAAVAGVWAAQVGYAVWREHALDRTVRDARDYGRPPGASRVGLTMQLDGQRTGVGVRFVW